MRFSNNDYDELNYHESKEQEHSENREFSRALCAFEDGETGNKTIDNNAKNVMFK